LFSFLPCMPPFLFNFPPCGPFHFSEKYLQIRPLTSTAPVDRIFRLIVKSPSLGLGCCFSSALAGDGISTVPLLLIGTSGPSFAPRAPDSLVITSPFPNRRPHSTSLRMPSPPIDLLYLIHLFPLMWVPLESKSPSPIFVVPPPTTWRLSALRMALHRRSSICRRWIAFSPVNDDFLLPLPLPLHSDEPFESMGLSGFYLPAPPFSLRRFASSSY